MSYFDEVTKANAEETLKQEELDPLFSRANQLLKECLQVLAQDNYIVQFAIIDLGAEIAANTDRNKAIFNRSVEYNDKEELVDVKANKDKQQEELLCLCMNLQQAIAEKDIDTQVRIINNIQVSRRVFETTIIDWLNKVRIYNKKINEHTAAYISGNTTKQIQLESEIYALETTYNINANSGYGVIRYVNTRMEAIRSIYNRISKAYARVVLKMARSQSSTTDYVLDSYQNGNCGLLRAISSYDHVSNARFPGYAKWWIRQRMLFCMKEEANVIKVSSNTWQHYAKLEAIRHKTENANGHTTLEDLAEKSGYALSHVESIYNSIKTSQVKSLEYKLSDDGFTLATVASGGADDPVVVEDALTAREEILAIEELSSPEIEDKNNVNILMDNLTDKQKKIICLSFGLTDNLRNKIDKNKLKIEEIRQKLALDRTMNPVKGIES